MIMSMSMSWDQRFQQDEGGDPPFPCIMKILMLHFGGDDNPRACKITQSLRSAGNEVIFVGWDRDLLRDKRQVVPATKILLLKNETLGTAPGLRSLFAFYVFILRILRQESPDVVHCVNEEMAALILPFKRILFRGLVLDIFDGLADRVASASMAVRFLLRLCSHVAYIASDTIVVCDQRRLERLRRYRHKAIIIQNTPVDPGRALFTTLPDGPVTVSMVGNITERRGADVVVAALNNVPDVRLVTAGFLDDFSDELFSGHSQITHLGVLTPRQSLVVMAESDAVLAFYEPTTDNHIFASPSKLFDCMCVGRPVIINSETMVARWVVENRLGFSTPYHDVSALSRVFRSLGEGRSALPQFAQRARALYEDQYSWSLMETRLLEMYEKLYGRQSA